MQAALGDAWANPASVHAAGRRSRALLEAARARIAAAIGAEPADIVLTSGGTEACNLGVQGLFRAGAAVTTEVEHPAVARTLEWLEHARSACVTRLPVPRGVPPAPADVAAAVGGGGLVAVQWINHETGTRLPIEDYAEVCRRAGARLFVDGTQALGKLPIDVRVLGADAVAIASHKAGGPAGAGALWVRRGVDLDPLLAGGAQERGRRPGSPDLLACVGFGAACTVIGRRLEAHARLATLRERWEAVVRALGGAINATDASRVPTVVSASFRGRRGDDLVVAMDLEGVCLSSGAACSSGLSEPSAVLRAMYPDEPWRAAGALRSSFGPETTETELEIAAAALQRVLARTAA